MTDVIVPFPPISATTFRIKAADSLRSHLEHLADEADQARFPLTATIIGLALMAVEQDLAMPDAASPDTAGGE
jgi:hypothetical protein